MFTVDRKKKKENAGPPSASSAHRNHLSEFSLADDQGRIWSVGYMKLSLRDFWVKNPQVELGSDRVFGISDPNTQP